MNSIPAHIIIRMFNILVFLTAFFASGVASIAGFGVGSLLTPLLALHAETKLAIAIVSIPHLIATSIRFWMLRRHLDKKILLTFGLMSAAGGLVGAVFHAKLEAPSLTTIFGAILIFSGGMGVTDLSNKLRFGPKMAWIAGAISGTLGGLVGNQGGIRSAAMLSFDIKKETFVATATGIGLIVDAARMPIYFASEANGILNHYPLILFSVAGVILGTLLGTRILKWIPETLFRELVSGLILLLGIFMLSRS